MSIPTPREPAEPDGEPVAPAPGPSAAVTLPEPVLTGPDLLAELPALDLASGAPTELADRGPAAEPAASPAGAEAPADADADTDGAAADVVRWHLLEPAAVPISLIDPERALPPMPDMPTNSEQSALDWIDLYRERINLHRSAAELRKAIAEAERAELELDDARRRDADTRAEAWRSLVYTFYDEVNDETVRSAVGTLSAWSRREPGAPITVVLNSPGGRVLDGLALFDYLQRLRGVGHRLRIEVFGRAASMGGVLLQAGDERVIGRNAFLLIHEVSGGAEGRSSAIGDTVEFYELMETRLLAILAERSVLTERQIRTRWRRKDWWLGAEEALKLGFADAVG